MLNLLIAHHAEAAPFIEHYSLSVTKKENRLKYFESGAVRLLLTGEGEENSRASVSDFCAQLHGLEYDYWLNFGVAGSSQFPIGQLVRGSSIQYHGGESNDLAPWPIESADREIPGAIIRTVEKPELDYPGEGVFDMEVATLYSVLSEYGYDYDQRFMTLKLVSDGPARSADKLSKKAMIDLIKKNVQSITWHSDILSQTPDL
ncbi:MAG: hypothetical protein ACR2QW_14575 [bacterium]